MSQAAATQNSRPHRTVAIVGAIAALIVIAAFGVSVKHLRTEPFTTEAWEKGAALFTKDNPRLLMQDEVLARLRAKKHMSGDEIARMLGKPDEPFFIRANGMVTSGAGMTGASADYGYVIGIRPKSMTAMRALLILDVNFGKDQRMEEAFINAYDLPPGAAIVPAVIKDADKSVWVKPGGKVITVP